MGHIIRSTLYILEEIKRKKEKEKKDKREKSLPLCVVCGVARLFCNGENGERESGRTRGEFRRPPRERKRDIEVNFLPLRRKGKALLFFVCFFLMFRWHYSDRSLETNGLDPIRELGGLCVHGSMSITPIFVGCRDSSVANAKYKARP